MARGRRVARWRAHCSGPDATRRARRELMNKSWAITAAIGFSACTSPTVAPHAGGVGRAELRQAAPLAAARVAGDIGAAAVDAVQSQRATLGLGAGDSFANLQVDPD